MRRLRELMFWTPSTAYDVGASAFCEAFHDTSRTDATPSCPAPLVIDEALRELVHGVYVSWPQPDPMLAFGYDPPPNLRSFTMHHTGALAPEALGPLFSQSGLRRLVARSVQPPIARAILAAPALAGLEELDLFGDDLVSEPRLAQALGRSPALRDLRSLRIAVELDRELANALAERAPLLEHLALPVGATAAGLERLLATPLARRLRSLEIGHHGSRRPPFAIAEAPFERLETLTLRGFALDAGAAGALASSAGLATVRELHLPNCSVVSDAQAVLRARWPYYAGPS